MADSLFDNRYRYNYIYPRGRSGETLRAVDTKADERPVVIKRPNPNDAPPIRAGQEVSIINEREALTRLAGHPVLTELLGNGQFFVGGMPHQYIVMERAEGVIIADDVVRLASMQQRLPILEMVEIVGRLINLLRTAHDNDIVYNDVDAKHLFWNRETYELKVIDWGNAVFLEGDEVTMQGISRQSDIYQLGELLYFILSGGRRVEVPRDGDAEFQVDFHQDSQAIDPRLQAIVTRAVHPNLRYRYASMSEVNADLLRFRTPLEHDRNAIVRRTIDKLKAQDLSRNDLLALQANLQAAMRHNPAYPAARNTNQEIIDRLRDLEVAADLDAVKIYMRGRHWASAAELLSELRDRAGSKTAGLAHLLLDWCLLLADSHRQDIPSSVGEATEQLFNYRPDKAAHLLLLGDSTAEAVRSLEWRMAERVSARFPDVTLLQPNLLRVQTAIAQLETEGLALEEAQGILAGVNRALKHAAEMDDPGAAALKDVYSEVVEGLNGLNANLQAISGQVERPERRLPVNALTRALNASIALTENMDIIGAQAANNPRDALSALDASRAIDPANPAWVKVEDFLSLLYEILRTGQTYVPAADGSDLEKWLRAKHDELTPFAGQLFDEKLIEMIAGIETAQIAWKRYRDVIVAGDKAEATAALEEAAGAVHVISPTLSNWFHQLRSVLENANYVERHSVPGHLGRTLADGWAAFDQGTLADAQRLGQQALEIARSESEQFIAQRLWKLSRVMRDWVERNGVESEDRTSKALLDIEDLFTDNENRAINGFATQMPSTETYLKAMSQGLVQLFAKNNTAALRILFAQYILSGVLDAHDGAIDDARFWQAAALRTLPDLAERHIALRKLDEYIAKRESLLNAESILNEVSGPHIVDSLAELARQLDSNPESRLLAPVVQSLRALETALQDWADAEFRSAGNKIDEVLRGITEAESNAGIRLENYRSWLNELNAALAELSVKRRSLLQDIDRQTDDPLPSIRDAIGWQADITEDLLGYKHAQMMLGWRDTYEAFLNIYQGDRRRSQKLEAMDEHFKAMFIDRNPAYPLFRHWYRVVEALPEEPEPPPEPEPIEEAPIPYQHAIPVDEPTPDDEIGERPARGNRWLFNAVLLVGIVLVVGGVLSLAGSGNLDRIISGVMPDPAAPSEPASDEATSDENTVERSAEIAASPQTPAQEEPEPAEEVAAPIAETALPATEAPTTPPTAVPTLANTKAPTAIPTRILPAGGLTGSQNLLKLFNSALAAPFWDAARFSQQNGSWRLGQLEATDGDTLVLSPPADLMESSFGNQAARRITGMETEITLLNTNPGLVSGEDIYFGIALQDLSGDNVAGIQVQQVGPSVISLALYRDGVADVISQRSVNNMIARLRLDHDRSNGTVSAYFNDSPIGEPMSFDAADILPAIFVKDGGVIIGVSAWDLTLE
ncbi:MAG: hypothetical protein OXG78_17250 [Chloroflexi bacterium]|nr:hypothetical protein [Chloroflexota bacterium]